MKKSKMILLLVVVALFSGLSGFFLSDVVRPFPKGKAQEAVYYYDNNDPDNFRAAMQQRFSFEQMITLYKINDSQLMRYVNPSYLSDIKVSYAKETAAQYISGYSMEEYLAATGKTPRDALEYVYGYYDLSEVKRFYEVTESSSIFGRHMRSR